MSSDFLSRRALLGAAATAGALSFTSGIGRATRLAWSAPWIGDDLGGNLVLLQLSGGNDGLSTVVPFADDAYQAARPNLAKQRADVFALDDYRGLHASATGLRDAWEAGQLAIVEGCGYAQPNRSHFKSMEIWHTADTRGRLAGDGWIGRLCDAAWKRETDVNRLIHVGAKKPYSLTSKVHPSASFEIPEGYRWIEDEGGIAAYEEHAKDAGGTLGALRRAMGDAKASSTAVRQAVGRYRPKVSYPNGDLGAALRSTAALLAGSIGTRIVSVGMGGFDTHNDERARHDRQMTDLGEALAAFRTDLAETPQGKRTTVLLFSEFGRRVAENGSRGTDHGTAGPMFVMGQSVKGGLYGKHPSLTELDKGDMVFTTDFRSVYNDVAQGLFGVAPDFLGKDWGRLGIL